METKIQIQEYKLKKQEEEDILRQLEEEKRQPKQVSRLELERIKDRVNKIPRTVFYHSKEKCIQCFELLEKRFHSIQLCFNADVTFGI